jgi:hypothetical protein
MNAVAIADAELGLVIPSSSLRELHREAILTADRVEFGLVAMTDGWNAVHQKRRIKNKS